MKLLEVAPTGELENAKSSTKWLAPITGSEIGGELLARSGRGAIRLVKTGFVRFGQ
jgi:hypothetical protein